MKLDLRLLIQKNIQIPQRNPIGLSLLAVELEIGLSLLAVELKLQRLLYKCYGRVIRV